MMNVTQNAIVISDGMNYSESHGENGQWRRHTKIDEMINEQVRALSKCVNLHRHAFVIRLSQTKAFSARRTVE